MAAQQAALSAHGIFPHVRIVMGMVIGLGLTRLLSGLARIVQHPKQYRVYGVHLAWAGSVLLMLVHYWWWEFGLFQIQSWTFGTYLFIIVYAIVLFVLCAALFPESMQDYRSYEDYFYEQRGWRWVHLGEDPILFTDRFTLEGSAMGTVRRAVNISGVALTKTSAKV